MSRGPEKDLQDAAADLLRRHHFLVFHQRPGLTKDGGYVSAVDYDGVGFPDLIAMRPGAPVICIEVKSATGAIRPDQRDWLSAASGATGTFYGLLAPSGWRIFEKSVIALSETHPIPDGWIEQCAARAWRHQMRKAKTKLTAKLAAGERIGPATMTTTLEWPLNEVVKIASKTWKYRGHGSDGSICLYGPVVYDGQYDRWLPAQRAKFRCVPGTTKILRKSETGKWR